MPDSIHDDMIDSGWYDCIEFWSEEKKIPLKILQHVFCVILPPTLMHTNELWERLSEWHIYSFTMLNSWCKEKNIPHRALMRESYWYFTTHAKSDKSYINILIEQIDSMPGFIDTFSDGERIVFCTFSMSRKIYGKCRYTLLKKGIPQRRSTRDILLSCSMQYERLTRYSWNFDFLIINLLSSRRKESRYGNGHMHTIFVIDILIYWFRNSPII